MQFAIGYGSCTKSRLLKFMKLHRNCKHTSFSVARTMQRPIKEVWEAFCKLSADGLVERKDGEEGKCYWSLAS